MTKYRYMVVHEGLIEARDPKDAEGLALAMADGGFAQSTAVQVEEVREGDSGEGN